MRKGQVFYSPQFGTTILVRRVAADRSWADITVQDGRTTGTVPGTVMSWNKRQVLTDGKFPYEVEEVMTTPGGLHANDTSPWRGALTEHPTPDQTAQEDSARGGA